MGRGRRHAGPLRRAASRRRHRRAGPGPAPARRPRARRQPDLAGRRSRSRALRGEPLRRPGRCPKTCWSSGRCWPSPTARSPSAPGRRSPTARRWSPPRPSGKGWLILFHVTADTSWSNLPLSGTFVDMLRRIVAFSTAAGPRPPATTGAVRADDCALSPARRLRPLRQSRPRGPADSRRCRGRRARTASIRPASMAARTASARSTSSATTPMLPPFEASLVAGRRCRALSDRGADRPPAVAARARPRPLPRSMRSPSSGSTARSASAAAGRRRDDRLDRRRGARHRAACAARRAGRRGERPVRPRGRRRRPTSPMSSPAMTSSTRRAAPGCSASRRCSPSAPRSSRATRSASIPARDELAFFPLLYWPIDPASAAADAPATMARIDAYMRQGGSVLFDTRDQLERSTTVNSFTGTPAVERLREMLSSLDIPPLEPVPADHVLTKAFYLLNDFPGRYAGGPLWVEATADARRAAPTGRRRPATASRRSSSPRTTSPRAWAIDENGTLPLPDRAGRSAAARDGLPHRRQHRDVHADRQLQGRPGARAGAAREARAVMTCVPRRPASDRWSQSLRSAWLTGRFARRMRASSRAWPRSSLAGSSCRGAALVLRRHLPPQRGACCAPLRC